MTTVGNIVYQHSIHTIEGRTFDFLKVSPTNGDPTQRKVIVTDAAGNTVEANFTHEGFELFKAIVNEY